MKKLYLLDRNAIAEIKKSADGAKTDANKLKKLKSIDLKGNFVSGMLSVREGQSKKIESEKEIQTQIVKDMPYLNAFYSKARTDSSYFIENKEFASESFGHPEGRELNWHKYIEFIKKIQADLYQPIKKELRFKQACNILEHANSTGVPKGHIIVACSLSSLYGNQSATKILKPSPNMSEKEADERAYNCMSDLICLTRVLDAQTHVEKDYLVKFLTFDKPLSDFFKSIQLNWASQITDIDGSSGVETNITYPQAVFPEIKCDEFEKLTKIWGST